MQGCPRAAAGPITSLLFGPSPQQSCEAHQGRATPFQGKEAFGGPLASPCLLVSSPSLLSPHPTRARTEPCSQPHAQSRCRGLTRTPNDLISLQPSIYLPGLLFASAFALANTLLGAGKWTTDLLGSISSVNRAVRPTP